MNLVPAGFPLDLLIYVCMEHVRTATWMVWPSGSGSISPPPPAPHRGRRGNMFKGTWLTAAYILHLSRYLAVSFSFFLHSPNNGPHFLPCIRRLWKMHSWIGNKILLKSLCWLAGNFMLSSLQAGGTGPWFESRTCIYIKVFIDKLVWRYMWQGLLYF
jgi:hypothetical protein